MRLFKGLPVGFLARALCWETKNPQRTPDSTRRCGGLDNDQPLLPTWTWAAWNRAVHYTHQYYFNSEGTTSDDQSHEYRYSFSFPWCPGAEYQLAEDPSDRRAEDCDRWVADVLRTGILTFSGYMVEWNKIDPIPVPHTMDDGTVWEYGKKLLLSVAQVYRAMTKFGGRSEHLHFVLFLREENEIYYREGGAWINNDDLERRGLVKRTVYLG
ncbi:hypothetical protein CC80DRAFT_162120 [Byssothecium circinans]|uniref:Uncharacterized protein n=1 Tax=Byssothecium circinans TaxID=147558 RepID=A0A6A5UN50_9PLEO|nr:hypothetical protein CC80DRAFT_162120 [Byssothecium circinans]